MLKKGFTLVELLVVIAALAIVLLIAMPVVGNVLDSSKQKAHDRQLELILKAMEQHVTNDIRTLEWAEDEYSITLKDLGALGYIKLPIKDPIAKNGNFDELMCLDATREATGDISYKIGNTCNLQPTLVIELRAGGSAGLFSFLKRNAPIIGNQIESIDVVNYKDIPSDALGSYDVSETRDGAVMLWYKAGSTIGCGTGRTEQCYKVYIGASKRVYAPSDSSYLFSFLPNLTSLNLQYLDTSKVTDMSEMFGCDYKLTTIELGPNFVTSSVATMKGMFSETDNLTTITTPLGVNVINFDTSNVANMERMFAYSGKLTSLEFGQKFITSSVTTMKGMFYGMTNLTSLDMRYFDFNKVTLYVNFLGNMPKTCKITVNSAGNDWLNNHGFNAWNVREIAP